MQEWFVSEYQLKTDEQFFFKVDKEILLGATRIVGNFKGNLNAQFMELVHR